MKVTIFGAGYVGLVTAACLADVGHEVMCADTNRKKINKLQQGKVPIHEPGLEPLIVENLKLGNLHFTDDLPKAVNFSDLLFIAVGTPPQEDGSADLIHVLDVAGEIGKIMETDKIVVTKSTVPVGTAELIHKTISVRLEERSCDLNINVASNPEFLKQGAAVTDFMKPDRIVIGTASSSVTDMLNELYAPYNRVSNRLIIMDIRSAELTKYAANGMLATKISFINDMANLAEKIGADIEQVRKGIGSDPRIGYQFIYPGCGYGGSCFPKDVRALLSLATSIGCDLPVLRSVELTNTAQHKRLFSLINGFYEGFLEGLTFAVWGLAFKANTDDMREAPSRVLLEALWRAGAKVQAYDPEAMYTAESIYGKRDDLTLFGTRDAALTGADALVICTEWQHFRAPNFETLKKELSDKVIFDGRNLYEPARVSRHGLTYFAIGRGASVTVSNVPLTQATRSS